MAEGPDYLRLYQEKRLDPRHPDHKKYIVGYENLFDPTGELSQFYKEKEEELVGEQKRKEKEAKEREDYRRKNIEKARKARLDAIAARKAESVSNPSDEEKAEKAKKTTKTTKKKSSPKKK